MKKNIFIGGAWPYANNSLHVGHLAALLPGDVIARYYRSVGNEVIYVSGTDSHGTPITVRAKQENVNPKDIALYYHNEFIQNFKDLDFSYDCYTSTMTEYHAEKVKNFLKIIMDNGFIYKKDELQDYCPKCDAYLSDREIIGKCPYCGGDAKGDQCDNCLATLNAKDVKDKKCSICNSKTIEKMNSHLYFALSKFQNDIEELTNQHINQWRNNAISETKKFLEMKLIDRAVTRQLDWGIDVPFKGFEDKKVYVWIEAVLGYLTAGEKVAEERGINFKDFMEKGNVLSYYSHGKDNIPFHTVIFPSLLMSIDKNINLPDFIVSCEYVNMNNEKMSKSKGNLISVNELIKMFPKDSIRYFMISNGPENKDMNFTIENFIIVHNKFLVGALGNFINRNFSFINKKFNGVIKEGKIDEDIRNLTLKTYEEVGSLIEKGKLKAAIDAAMNYVNAGNKYYNENEPWNKIKNDINAFNDISYTCAYMIANISNLFSPFIPETCQKIKDKLSIKGKAQWEEIKISGDLIIQNDDLLFERLQ